MTRISTPGRLAAWPAAALLLLALNAPASTTRHGSSFSPMDPAQRCGGHADAAPRTPGALR